jgi:hypothetical protein
MTRDASGDVELPCDSEFNEVPTGKYETYNAGGNVWSVQRPDGSFCLAMTMGRCFTDLIVAELERARLDNSSDCFETLLTVTKQRDALQTMYDHQREANKQWADLMVAEQFYLQDEVARLNALLEGKAAAEAVPTGYAINKDIGGWYFTEPNPASDTIRMRWSSMEEAQLDARNHRVKIEAVLKDPDTGQPWSLGPIDRNVLKHVREFLEGYPDHHPVAIKAERHSSGRLTLELEKVPQKMATWDNGQPMSDDPRDVPAKPLSELLWGELPSEHADYIEASADVVKPLHSRSRLRFQFWRWGPFSAMVRAKVNLDCCHILRGDVFEVTKDYGDGLHRLVGTPFKVGSPHFFDWDDVDAQLEMIEETTSKPTEDVDSRPARVARRTCDHWVISRPAGRQLYRAALVTFDGDEFRSADSTMHAETLTLIRQKVLHWFRTRKQPAACVPREEEDAPHIIETWL